MDTPSAAYKQIMDLLICPQCSSRVEAGSEQIRCLDCGALYPVLEGIPHLARPGTVENWGECDGAETNSMRYQQQYRKIEGAAKYNEAYKQKLFKRMSTAREFRLLQRLLGTQPRSEVLLDLPCGGGRLSPQIAPFTKLLVEADVAEGQVLYGKRNSSLDTPQLWMTASAFHIPFQDESIDGVVCCRLCHHLPTESERERLLQELLRVAKRFVIMTFFDYHSLKNTLRRMRRPIDHKPPKKTMKISLVRDLARANGASLTHYPALSRLGSGHRYALMVKER